MAFWENVLSLIKTPTFRFKQQRKGNTKNIKDEIVKIIDIETIRINNFWKARIHTRDMEITRLQNICKRNGIGWKKAATKKTAIKSTSI